MPPTGTNDHISFLVGPNKFLYIIPKHVANQTDLVDLDVAEYADEVHHGGVELQAQVGRTDVVTDAEKSLEHQGAAQTLKR